MGRSRVISDEQILKTAQEVFLEEGFAASTLAIARRAGISEASIFKRFATKETLFFASMGLSPMTEQIPELKTLVGQGDIQVNLVTLALRILEFHRNMMPRIMMLTSKGKRANTQPLSDSLVDPLSAENHLQIPFPCSMGLTPSLPIQEMILDDFKALAQFFHQEQDLGRLRNGNPEVLATLFFGGLMSYQIQERLRNAEHSEVDSEAYVRNLIDYLWQGISS